MKKRLDEKLKKVCESVGTQAAAEKFDQLSKSIEIEYDKRVAAGMSELDAYREMLRDVDAIEELLRQTPKTAEEQAREDEKKARKEWNRKLNAIEGSIQGLWWLLTILFYFFVSIVFGGWRLTWLLFLSSSIGSIIIGMLFKYNRGVPKKELFADLHGILWLAVVALYFFVSIVFGGWRLTWLLFLLGAVLNVVLNVVQKLVD